MTRDVPVYFERGRRLFGYDYLLSAPFDCLFYGEVVHIAPTIINFSFVHKNEVPGYYVRNIVYKVFRLRD